MIRSEEDAAEHVYLTRYVVDNAFAKRAVTPPRNFDDLNEFCHLQLERHLPLDSPDIPQ